MIDAWIDAVYRFLNSLGYPHPLHPALVHMTIGLTMGALVFASAALFFNYREDQTSRCRDARLRPIPDHRSAGR